MKTGVVKRENLCDVKKEKKAGTKLNFLWIGLKYNKHCYRLI
jgi:hypothetical protein